MRWSRAVNKLEGFPFSPHLYSWFVGIPFLMGFSELFAALAYKKTKKKKKTTHSSIFIVVIYVAHKGWLKGKVTPEFLHNLFDCAEPQGTDRPKHSRQTFTAFTVDSSLSKFTNLGFVGILSRSTPTLSLKLRAFCLLQCPH